MNEKEHLDYVKHALKYLGEANVDCAFDNYKRYCKQNKHDRYKFEGLEKRVEQYKKEISQ